MIAMRELKLNNEIFSMESIRAAKEAYLEIANITVLHGRRCTILFFTNCRHDVERTVKEFENYLIGIENSR